MSTSDDDARLIADSSLRFAMEHGGPAPARRFERDGAFDAAGWRGMAELGWFGIAVPERAGGLGLDQVAACLLADIAGRALLVAPLTSTIAAASALADSDAPAARQALDALIAGAGPVAVCTGARDADGTVTARWVPDANFADAALVARGADDGFEVRRVQWRAPGVAVDAARCVDGSSLADVTVTAAAWDRADPILDGVAGEAAWRRATDLGRLLDAAALCGLAESALAMALDYMRLRRQFGVPIGSFQALQHRAVDCHVQRSAARALVDEAARAVGTPRASWASAAAFRLASRAALHVTKETIQFHGAIGFADEHDAGLYLRRAMVWSARHRA